MAVVPMWKIFKFGIISVIFTCIRNIQARVLPELPGSKESTESTIETGNFLDQISASKLECLLDFVENPNEKLDCIDENFGDDRSQFLLGELRNELLTNTLPNQDTLPDDVHDQNDDKLAADLNTLSDKSRQLPTTDDGIPIINSDKIKRVDEAVNTPKKEQQRNALGESLPEVTAQVVKSTDTGDVVVESNEEEDTRPENQINEEDEEEYDYDSSLVAKLYNMLQDMVQKETFDYGLKMNEDDDDSDEDEELENFVGDINPKPEAQELYQTEENDSNSEEKQEDGEQDKYANESDELGNELRNMQGDVGSNSGGDSEEQQQDIAEIEQNLVNELDKMLQIAKQAGTAKDKKDAAHQFVSSDKFLDDLRHMEKALKESTS